MSAKYNLTAEQATTFNFQFQIKNDTIPWDLGGYTAIMTVKPFAGSTTTTLLATTANGAIVLTEDTGRVAVTFTNVQTNITPGRYVYDLVLDSGAEVIRILEGLFIVSAGVTV